MANKKKPSKVEKVLHEFKEGSLESSSGAKVKSKKQALAISLASQRKRKKSKK